MYSVNAQLRRAAEHAANIPTQDEAYAAQIERETREEERAIKRICDDLNVVMHEASRVSLPIPRVLLTGLL